MVAVVVLSSTVVVNAYLPSTVTPHRSFATTARRTTSSSPPSRTHVSLSASTKKESNEWGIPYSSDLPPLYDTKKPTESLPNGGRVTLVGSGPGDPDLLTVKTHRLLTQMDNPDNTVVIVDRLVSPEILDLIACDYRVARKLPGCADLAQEEIYWWMYQALNQGKHVIRLKIGDPFVFGRGGEEILTCRRFGVEPVVVPVCWMVAG